MIRPDLILGTNPGDVWRIPTKGFKGPHFATFPPELVPSDRFSPPVLRPSHRVWPPRKRRCARGGCRSGDGSPRRHEDDGYVMRFGKLWNTLRQTGDTRPLRLWRPTVRGVVLDPFFGAGTVAVVAEEHGRDWIGIEISPEYAELARDRISSTDRTTQAGGGP